MFVKIADIEDLNTLIDFGKRISQEAPHFKNQPFNEEHALRFFTQLIQRQESIFLVCDEYGNSIGTLIGALDICWRTAQRLAYENGVYVLPEYRRSGAAALLIHHFIDWAKAYNADRIQLGTLTGIQTHDTLRLYSRLGFEQVGYVLEMEL